MVRQEKVSLSNKKVLTKLLKGIILLLQGTLEIKETEVNSGNFGSSRIVNIYRHTRQCIAVYEKSVLWRRIVAVLDQ